LRRDSGRKIFLASHATFKKRKEKTTTTVRKKGGNTRRLNFFLLP